MIKLKEAKEMLQQIIDERGEDTLIHLRDFEFDKEIEEVVVIF